MFLLKLPCFAPDIVEAIVGGTEPSGLSLEGLVKGLPIEWEEQRRNMKPVVMPR